MKFRFSDSLTINTDEEPWRRTGLRVGIFGDPGSGKSYTTAAVFVEQFLEQGGTVIIFEPRAEWQTLKSKFPDIQVVGGPYLQDIPFTASHPKLYADAVVENGISLIFYTADAPTIDKLIEFVADFLKHLMKGLERTKRPVMVVLEEANRYVPLSTRNHPEGAAPWVLGRMIGRVLELERDSRKLGVVPIMLSQRPQDINFAARQLDNLTLLGQFSPQDVGYLDKEVIKPMAKNLDLDIDAGDLSKLKTGQWLLVTRGEAKMIEPTVKRITQHGGDTPELTFVPEASSDVKAKVGSLAQKLKELLDQEQAEESELEKAKREKAKLEAYVVELEEKVKLGNNLRELLSGTPKEVGEKAAELERKLEAMKSQNDFLAAQSKKVGEENERLKRQIEGYSRIDGYFHDMIVQVFDTDIKPKVLELIRQNTPRQPVARTVVREVAAPSSVTPPKVYQEWLDSLPPTASKLLRYVIDNHPRNIPNSEIALRHHMKTDSYEKNWAPKLRKVPGIKIEKGTTSLTPP